VTEERVSVLLDLSLFRKHEVATFMTAFLENLYRLKAREQFRTPLMLIDRRSRRDRMPQKPQENERECSVRRGHRSPRWPARNRVHAHHAAVGRAQQERADAGRDDGRARTIAPQDLKAMDAWIEVHGEKSERDTLMDSLPALPVGDAWFWSPGWPTTDGIFQRVHVLPIETFDSGASPKAGEKRIEPQESGRRRSRFAHEADGGDDREGEGERSEAAEGRDPAPEEGAREEAQHQRQRSFDSEAWSSTRLRRSCREERTRAERKRWQPTMVVSSAI
jgi:hypothetical protein